MEGAQAWNLRGVLLYTPRRSPCNVLEAGNHDFFSIVQIFQFSPKIPQTTLDIYFTFWPSFAIFCLVSARFRRLTFYKICHFKSCVLQFRDKNKGLTENLLTKPKKISISFSKQFCDFICPQKLSLLSERNDLPLSRERSSIKLS